MTDQVLNREFLAYLQSEYQHVRENRADQLLNCASADTTFDAETRRHHLEAALAFDPHGMAATLHDIMSRQTSAPMDRINAATLYLYGGEKRWWEMPRSAAERARSLKTTGKDKPVKLRNTKFAAADYDDLGFCRAITQASARVEACLKDPGATDATKVEAIARFFRVVGRIAPDQLDASIAKATEALSANPQPPTPTE